MANREELYQYLMKKNRLQDDRRYDAMERADERASEGDLLATLSRAGAMAGSLGGKSAESVDFQRANDAAYRRNMSRIDTDASTDAKRDLLYQNLLAKAPKADKWRTIENADVSSGKALQEDEFGRQRVVDLPEGVRGIKKPSSDNAPKWGSVKGAQVPKGKVLQEDQFGNTRIVDLPTGVDSIDKKQVEIGPVEKAQITTLGGKVANQASIVNVLVPAKERLIAAMKAGNKDLAVKIGQGMIKALNSDQGADAVGVEEANRIGNLLETEFRVFKPGKTFGIDLDLFADQVEESIQKMKGAVVSGQKQLESLEKGGKIGFESGATGDLTPEEQEELKQLEAEFGGG